MLCHTRVHSHSGPPCAIETAAATCAKPMKMSRSMGPSVELVLTSPEPAWTEVCFFIPQTSYATAVRYLSTLDVRRAVGGLRRCCECR